MEQGTHAETYVLPGYVYDHEAAVVWLEPQERFVYLREVVTPMASPARRPRVNVPRRIVAYAKLRKGAPRETYLGVQLDRWARRYWYVADHDPYEGGGYPSEGVDPRSVMPGQPSRRPVR